MKYTKKTCTVCKRQFRTKLEDVTECTSCRVREDYKKPKAEKNEKKPKVSLDKILKELRQYNELTGEHLTYGQYQARRMINND